MVRQTSNANTPQITIKFSIDYQWPTLSVPTNPEGSDTFNFTGTNFFYNMSVSYNWEYLDVTTWNYTFVSCQKPDRSVFRDPPIFVNVTVFPLRPILYWARPRITDMTRYSFPAPSGQTVSEIVDTYRFVDVDVNDPQITVTGDNFSRATFVSAVGISCVFAANNRTSGLIRCDNLPATVDFVLWNGQNQTDRTVVSGCQTDTNIET